ncbi:MAG: S6 family peptidase, partial [Conchiformibius sp.]|nr:S6 family peptidase [Conchiformibius sp.]
MTRKSPPVFRSRPSILAASIISLGMAAEAQASFVRNDIDYQYFRDFAENKGQFTPGASNITVYKKDGTVAGVMLPSLPMPDLSMVSTSGVATLIDPQYITSVQHNSGYGSVRFGQHGNNPDVPHYDYRLIDRNDYPNAAAQTAENVPKDKQLHPDYHIPRLSKLVTETAPAPVTQAGLEANTYNNTTRFPIFIRAGSGTQWLRHANGTNQAKLSGAYNYLTGGGTLTLSKTQPRGWTDFSSNVFDDAYGPMATYGAPGDSGSPIFAYDAQEKRWVVVSVLNFYATDSGNWNRAAIQRPDFILKKRLEDIGANITNTVDKGVFEWTANGNSSSLSNPANASAPYRVDLTDATVANQDSSKSRPSLNHGKSIIFSGNKGTLKLNSDINQGAGALHFNTDFTVFGSRSNQTWLGAGVDVAAGKTVEWRVHNPDGDRLSKIGQGTLKVDGVGKNNGSISVGDGKVILAQRADKAGNKQAFSEVGIVSGRPTVVLNDAGQVSPDQIYFGFRGGRLDLNGNHIAFQRAIRNLDEGARIVNHNNNRKAAVTVNVRSKEALLAPMTESDIEFAQRLNKSNGIYSYKNPYQGNRIDYFVLKPGGNYNQYYPTNGQSNGSWEFLSSDRDEAIRIYLERENAKRNPGSATAYHGYFGETDPALTNGRLDVNYRADNGKDTMMLTGGTNLNGSLSVENGRLLLSGRPVSHARDVLNRTDVVRENEWIDRHFNATTFKGFGNGHLQTGRNVTELRGNISLHDSARATIGYIQGETPVCIRSEFDGKTTCAPGNISTPVLSNLTATRLIGDITMHDHSATTLAIGNYGRSISGSSQSSLRLHDTHWQMPANSTIGALHGTGSNAQITLNPRNNISGSVTAGDDYRTLTLNGDLSGAVRFNYLSDLANNRGDKVLVNGIATGNHTLHVRNTAAEPTNVNTLTLLQVNHGNQDKNNVNISLSGESGKAYVDAGTWRYELAVSDDNRYYLHNPVKEAELAKQREDAEKAKQAAEAKKLTDAEAARKQAEKLAADAEKARVAAETAKQEAEAAKARLETAARDDAAALQAARAEAAAASARAQESERAKTEAQRLAEEARRQQTAAETAKQTAEQQLNNARQQAASAEAAKQTAEQQLAAARRQAQLAETAKQNAEQQSAAAAAKLQEALTAKAQAEHDKAEAEAAKRLLEQSQGNNDALVQAARAEAENARQRAEQAQAQAQTAQAANLAAQNALNQAQAQAQAARDAEAAAAARAQTAEAAQSRAEQARTAAEQAKAEAEQQRNQAQAALNAAEAEKQRLLAAQVQDAAALQAAREAADTARLQAEQSAQAQEQARRQAEEAETRRRQAEEAKAQAEQLLTDARIRMTQAEEAKIQAERQSTDALNRLQNAEAEKQAAEEARRQAEAEKARLEQNQSADAQALSQAQTQAAEALRRAQAAEAEKQAAQNAFNEAQRQAQNALQAAAEAAERAQRSEADKLAAEEARRQAEQDKASAEAAKRAAEQSLAAAEAEKQRLLATQGSDAAAVQAARTQAEEALRRAQTAEAEKQAAQAALSGALKRADEADRAAAAAAQRAQRSEADKLAAEEARRQAEQDKASAEAAKRAAEQSLAAAEAEKQHLLATQGSDAAAVQAAQQAADAAKAQAAQAQAAQQDAERRLQAAEADKQAAQNAEATARQQAEAAQRQRDAAQAAQQAAEQKTAAAEQAKALAEEAKRVAERNQSIDAAAVLAAQQAADA